MPFLPPSYWVALAAYILNPLVDSMVARGSKRGRAVLLVFLLLLALIVFAAFLIIPRVANQAHTFVTDYGAYAAAHAASRPT